MTQLDLETVDCSVASLRNELERGRRHRCATEVSVRPLPFLAPSDIADWKELARQAAEPNPFQEPEFVLPLAEHLVSADALHVLVVQEVPTGRWLAACVFQACPPTLTRPLPHLRALTSPYSFLDSPLVHRDHVEIALRSAFVWLHGQRTWHGARFHTQRAEGEQAVEWQRQSGLLGLASDHDRAWQRAVTNLAALKDETLLDRCSRSRRKSLLRARRWLESSGPVSHQLVEPASSDAPACTNFLALEAMGWKGRQGTAISSRPDDLRFFQHMVDRFAQERRVLFGELRAGDQLIASTCNLIAGSTVFAFKLGWNPEFARGNPGHWSEIELATALAKERPDLRAIDSCSQPGSYVESVSTHLQPMQSSTYVWSRRAMALCEIRRQFRAIRSGWGTGQASAAVNQ